MVKRAVELIDRIVQTLPIRYRAAVGHQLVIELENRYRHSLIYLVIHLRVEVKSKAQAFSLCIRDRQSKLRWILPRSQFMPRLIVMTCGQLLTFT